MHPQLPSQGGYRNEAAYRETDIRDGNEDRNAKCVCSFGDCDDQLLNVLVLRRLSQIAPYEAPDTKKTADCNAQPQGSEKPFTPDKDSERPVLAYLRRYVRPHRQKIEKDTQENVHDYEKKRVKRQNEIEFAIEYGQVVKQKSDARVAKTLCGRFLKIIVLWQPALEMGVRIDMLHPAVTTDGPRMRSCQCFRERKGSKKKPELFGRSEKNAAILKRTRPF
jgi:hypothetical protein